MEVAGSAVEVILSEAKDLACGTRESCIGEGFSWRTNPAARPSGPVRRPALAWSTIIGAPRQNRVIDAPTYTARPNTLRTGVRSA